MTPRVIHVPQWTSGTELAVRFLGFEVQIDLLNKDTKIGMLRFCYVRAVRVFKESDFYDRMARYELDKLISSPNGDLGVFRIRKSPVMAPVVLEKLEPEDPMYFLVSTPDACVEVASFEEPTLL
jgi:hypothetical protein